MAPLKTRLGADAWLEAVIDLLLRRPSCALDVPTIYAETLTARSDELDALLFEHPSLRHGPNDVVRFVPFRQVRTQDELLRCVQDAFPRTHRRVDLRGTYAYVDADIDELVFRRRVLVVDASSRALLVPPVLPSERQPALARRWQSRA